MVHMGLSHDFIETLRIYDGCIKNDKNVLVSCEEYCAVYFGLWLCLAMFMIRKMKTSLPHLHIEPSATFFVILQRLFERNIYVNP